MSNSCQIDICEELQALSFLYQPSPNQLSIREKLSKDERHEVHLMNALALYALNEQASDVVAVSFVRSARTLVLCRNNGFSEKDKTNAHSLLAKICQLKCPEELYFEPLKSSINVVNGRLRKVFQMNTSFIDTLLNEFFADLPTTWVDSIDENARAQETFYSVLYGRRKPRELLSAIFQGIKDMAQKFVETVIPKEEFAKLLAQIFFVTRTNFYRQNFNLHPNRDGDLMVEFKRRLNLVVQYHDAAELIYAAREDFNHFRIDFVPVETPAVRVSLAYSAYNALSIHAADVDAGKRQAACESITQWLDESHPLLHAEIQMILHLEKRLYRPQLRVIGCSKRSCISCWKWIQAFNDLSGYTTSGKRWTTSGTHDKAYMHWALSGNDVVDGVVVSYIHQTLIKVLHDPHQRTHIHADCFASSPESDA